MAKLFYDESILIAWLKAKLPTTVVKYSEEYNSIYNTYFVSSTALTSPILYVGHTDDGIGQGNDMVHSDGYMEIDSPTMLLSEIQILCKRAELSELISSVKEAMHGFTPFRGDGDYSSAVYRGATKVAASGKFVWWSLSYGINMPRISFGG
jgi:hypothetical protein